MNITPTQNIWFDDAATSAMGEAFDRYRKSLRDFGFAPEIIANLIIAAATDGERNFSRLEQALKAFGVADKSMPVDSIGRPSLCSVTRQRDHREARLASLSSIRAPF
jgi:hypothetical protein